MAQKKNYQKDRQIGRKAAPAKKPLIDPRYKNTFWTAVILLVLIIFFIVNNTRSGPSQGPLPPGYNPGNLKEKLNTEVPNEIKITDSNSVKK